MESIASGQGESAGSTSAANQALQNILTSDPLDVEDFVRKAIFEPSLAEANDFIPFIQREGSVTGNRFGDTTSRAIGDLLADVNRTSTAARESGTLQARSQNLANIIMASELGLRAEGEDIENKIQTAIGGALEMGIPLEQMAAVLGVPVQVIQSMLVGATTPVKALGQVGPNIFAQALANTFEEIGSQQSQSLFSGGGIMAGGGGMGGGGGGIMGLLGGGGGGGIGGLAALGCHCAAEYFGWFTPRWFAARRAILQGVFGTPFLLWYSQNSRALAQDVRRNEKVRELWRPIFIKAAELGRF